MGVGEILWRINRMGRIGPPSRNDFVSACAVIPAKAGIHRPASGRLEPPGPRSIRSVK